MATVTKNGAAKAKAKKRRAISVRPLPLGPANEYQLARMAVDACAKVTPIDWLKLTRDESLRMANAIYEVAVRLGAVKTPAPAAATLYIDTVADMLGPPVADSVRDAEQRAALDREGYQLGIIDRDGEYAGASEPMTLREAIRASVNWTDDENSGRAFIVIMPPRKEGGAA